MPRPQAPSLPSAPKRQTDRRPVTPLIGDLLLYEVDEFLGKSLPAYGTKHPKRLPGKDEDQFKYPNHELVLARPVENERDGVYQLIYAAERESQDLYNFQFTQADIGGQKFDAVQRDYLIKRADFTPQTPAMGAVMPDLPEGKFAASSYVLANRAQVRTEPELDSLYIAERRTYVKKVSIVSLGTDDLNGKPLTATTTLYYRTETVPGPAIDAESLFADPSNSFWGLQTDGTKNDGQQLSENWYAITNTVVVNGTLGGGVIAIDSYTTNENYYWPPVLGTLDIRGWARHDQGIDIYPDYTFLREGYRGPCKATVTRSWSKTPQTIAQVEIMRPERIQYASPGFSMNIPECLHGLASLTCDYGTGDPVYKVNVGSTKWFPATNYTDWPSTIVGSDDQRPFRGGFLRTRIVIDQPA